MMSRLARMLSMAALLLVTAPAGFASEDAEREGGIIGTGIVGTITRLGSIYVNGQHILLGEGLEVDGAAFPLQPDELRPGHTVAVTVRRDGDDWQAVHLRQVLPVVGPVSDLSGTEARVLGTWVDLSAVDRIVSQGDWIAVSGLWQNDRIIASRIDPLPADQRAARISGTYLGRDDQGRDRIGNTLLTGLEARHLNPGDLVRAEGLATGDGLQVTRLETRLFDRPVGVVQIEGYYSPPQPDGLYTVLGSGLVAFTDQPGMITVFDRVVRCGGAGQLGSPSANAELPTEVRNTARQLDCDF